VGIELKDLVVGSYYKGYHVPAPAGLKCFYYVSDWRQVSGLTEVDVVRHFRKGQGGVGGWVKQTLTGPATHATLLKTQCNPADLRSEGVPFPVAKPASAPATPSPAASSPKKPIANSSAKPTAADLAALAKSKRNEGKVAIPENARSPKCVKCNGANRSIALFQFSTYFCPICEPE